MPDLSRYGDDIWAVMKQLIKAAPKPGKGFGKVDIGPEALFDRVGRALEGGMSRSKVIKDVLMDDALKTMYTRAGDPIALRRLNTIRDFYRMGVTPMMNPGAESQVARATRDQLFEAMPYLRGKLPKALQGFKEFALKDLITPFQAVSKGGRYNYVSGVPLPEDLGRVLRERAKGVSAFNFPTTVVERGGKKYLLQPAAMEIGGAPDLRDFYRSTKATPLTEAQYWNYMGQAPKQGSRFALTSALKGRTIGADIEPRNLGTFMTPGGGISTGAYDIIPTKISLIDFMKRAPFKHWNPRAQGGNLSLTDKLVLAGIGSAAGYGGGKLGMQLRPIFRED